MEEDEEAEATTRTAPEGARGGGGARLVRARASSCACKTFVPAIEEPTTAASVNPSGASRRRRCFA